MERGQRTFYGLTENRYYISFAGIRIFGNETWIISEATKDIWLAILHCWSTDYIEHPYRIRRNRESGVSSARFHDLASTTGIELQLYPVEAHTAIGTGQRYHDPLRQIYSVLCRSYIILSQHLLFRLAVKRMNEAMEPEGLVLPLLVIGLLLSFPVIKKHFTAQTKRMSAMVMEREELAITTAELRITRAI